MYAPTEIIAPAPYVSIPLAAQVIGLIPGAIRAKINRGDWLEGREYRYLDVCGGQATKPVC